MVFSAEASSHTAPNTETTEQHLKPQGYSTKDQEPQILECDRKQAQVIKGTA